MKRTMICLTMAAGACMGAFAEAAKPVLEDAGEFIKDKAGDIGEAIKNKAEEITDKDLDGDGVIGKG